MQNAPESSLTKARDALDRAGERQAEIRAAKEDVNRELRELAATRKNKGRGRPSAAHSRKKKQLEAKLSALDDGRLPGEAPPRPLPAVQSGAALAQAVSSNAQHYAAAGRPPVGASRKTARLVAPRDLAPDEDVAPDDPDDDAEDPEAASRAETETNRGDAAATARIVDCRIDDDRSISAQVAAENPTLYKIPPGHKRFIESVVADVKSNSNFLAMRRRSVFQPPDPDLKPEMLGALKTHVWAPHLSEGKPKPDLQRDLRRPMRPPETAATMPMAEILPPPAAEGPAALPGAEAAPLAGPVVLKLVAPAPAPAAPTPAPAPALAAPASPAAAPPPDESRSAKRKRRAREKKQRQRRKTGTLAREDAQTKERRKKKRTAGA